MKLEGVNFSSAVNLINNKLAGTGKAGIDNINLSDALFVEKVATSVTLGSGEVKLAPLSAIEGRVADPRRFGGVA